jgi:group I intron endonuclease
MLIYLILNRVNGKVYIGKWARNSLLQRWKMHLYTSKTGGGCAIGAAIRKYGEDAFSVYLLSSWASSKNDLSEQEKYFIARYRSHNPEYGYNLTMGGEGGTPTQATRRKMGEARKRFTFTSEIRQKMSKALEGTNNPMFGKHHSSDTRKKMSLSHIGVKKGPPSLITRERIRKKALGHIPWNKGTKVAT